MNPALVGEALTHCLSRDLTFAAFRSPGAPLRVWVQRNARLDLVEAHLLQQAGPAFVIAPFHGQMGHVHLLRPDVDLVFDSSSPPDLAALDTCTGEADERTAVPSGQRRSDHARVIAAAKVDFEKGPLKKVVLARTVEETLEPGSIPDLFLAAEAAYPDAFIALLHTPLHGTWIGASPERLLITDNGIATIDALAGTMPSTHAPNDHTAWGLKEREEQQLVTRHILHRLQALGIRVISTSGPHVKRMGQLAHLHTMISAELGAMDPGTLAVALHPTPAVCGEPTEEAQRFIHEHEPQPRRLYAGFWGPAGISGRTEFQVNIRCAQVIGNRVVLHVGGGITPGSDPESEWEETELKASTWRKLIHSLPAARIS